MEAQYREAYRTGLLSERAGEAHRRLAACDLCPRRCGVDRLGGELGVCRGGAAAEVSSAGPHFGEEPPLTGRLGSGTIFMTNCGLRCVFCQNHDISQEGRGSSVTSSQLAGAMIRLQREGCHNINFVTPTHYLPQILEALGEAAAIGLEVPIVWNCGGYENFEALALLDGIVDIYMPDVKFSAAGPPGRFCDAPDYYERAREAVLEMHQQVGDLVINEAGLAERGLLVRHLVLPAGLAGTGEVARFLAHDVSPGTYLNIMDQYRPCCRAFEFDGLERGITGEEYEEAVRLARDAGLVRGPV